LDLSIRFLAVLLALGSGLTPGACQSAVRDQPSEPGFVVGQEVRVEGVVLENVLACTRDLSCHLRLKTAQGEVRVVYAAPRGTPCPNTAATRSGMKILQHARVRVFAQATGKAELSTCAKEVYAVSLIDR
jgi:hypothetical protein